MADGLLISDTPQTAVSPAAGADSSPADRAALGADAGAAGVSDTTARLYGRVHVSLDEAYEFLEQAAAYPGATVGITRVDELGRRVSIPSLPVDTFDFGHLVKRYGAGEYWLRLSAPGVRKAIKQFKLIMEAPPAMAGTTQPAQQMPAAQPAPIAPPQPAAAAPLGIDLGALLVNMIQQQSNMMQAILVKQIEKPAGGSSTDLETLLKLAERLNGGRGRGQDEAEPGMGGMLGQILAGFMAANANNQRHNAPPRTPPVVRAGIPTAAARPVITGPTGPVESAAGIPARTIPAATDPNTPAAGPEIATPVPAPGDSATAVEQPTADNPLLSALQSLAPAEPLIAALLNKGADAERIAEAMASALSDDELDLILQACPEGQLAEIVIARVPAMAFRRDLLNEVEGVLRSMLEEEGSGETEGIGDEGGG
jgi:hypothetical protein